MINAIFPVYVKVSGIIFTVYIMETEIFTFYIMETVIFTIYIMETVIFTVKKMKTSEIFTV